MTAENNFLRKNFYILYGHPGFPTEGAKPKTIENFKIWFQLIRDWKCWGSWKASSWLDEVGMKRYSQNGSSLKHFLPISWREQTYDYQQVYLTKENSRKFLPRSTPQRCRSTTTNYSAGFSHDDDDDTDNNNKANRSDTTINSEVFARHNFATSKELENDDSILIQTTAQWNQNIIKSFILKLAISKGINLNNRKQIHRDSNQDNVPIKK